MSSYRDHTGFGTSLVNAHYKHVLVMRAIENYDLALAERPSVCAPKEVASGLNFAGRLKPKTQVPCGFVALNTWRITPSLPPASRA